MDLRGTEHGGSVSESAVARVIPAAARTVFWWAAGTAVTVAPMLASLFTANRSPVFWPALFILSVVGSTVGLTLHLDPSTRLAERLTRLPTPMLVAIGYPISIGAGLGLENTGPGTTRQDVFVLLALTATPLAFGWLCRWGPLWDPPGAMRFAALVWISLSVVLLPVLGLGLFIVPLAVSSYQAARHLDRLSAVPADT